MFNILKYFIGFAVLVVIIAGYLLYRSSSENEEGFHYSLYVDSEPNNHVPECWPAGRKLKIRVDDMILDTEDINFKGISGGNDHFSNKKTPDNYLWDEKLPELYGISGDAGIAGIDEPIDLCEYVNYVGYVYKEPCVNKNTVYV